MTAALALVDVPEARVSLPAPLVVAAGRSHTAETILRAWFEGKSAHTIRSYRHDLRDFAAYFSSALDLRPCLDINGALGLLFSQSSPSAHEVVLGFRHSLESARLSSSSVNRHLATLRSVTKLGRMLGMMTWYLEVPGVKAERRRPTAGPTIEDVRRMLDSTGGETAAATRDHAIVLTLGCLGLRVSELCGLNIEDTDLERGSTWIKGKGRRERELVPLPGPVVMAVRRYLAFRGTSAGPLFLTRGRRRHGDGRLDTRSVLRIVRDIGQRVGLHVWCHGLRHTAITTAIEQGQKAGVGLDQIRAFSRHRTLATMLIYRDEHDRAATHRTLVDVVARAFESAAGETWE